MWRTDWDASSRPRSRSQVRSATTTSAMPPRTTRGGRPTRRKPASVPEPASGDMGNALRQGGDLAGGASVRNGEVEGEEVEVGGVELEIAERAPREQEVGQGRTAAGDGALQPLHHVAGEWQGSLHQPAAAGERRRTLLVERGDVADAGRTKQQLRLSRRLRQRGCRPCVG